MTDAQVEVEEKLRRKKEEEEEMWREYAEQRKLQRAKEEEELRKLKERQAKRREARAQQEKHMAEQKRVQDEKRQKELEEKKAREAEAKRKRLEEAEKKRQAMQAAKEKKENEPVKPNFTIIKREDMDNFAALGGSGVFGKFANVMAARGEMGKTREQLEEDKKAILAMRVKPLDFEGATVDDLKKRANELWERVKSLEAEKYDLEERRKIQEYDLKELAERQRQIGRSRALKKGLDPEALQGPHPPKIQVASKYERRTDRRSFTDKKELFSGGFEAQQDAEIEKQWENKLLTFKETSGGKLPLWDPENPKNKEVLRRRGLDDEDDDDDEPVYQPPPRQSSPPQPEEEEEEEEEE
ncbi:troponin T-like isoform X2 [Varroa destructor]|uniref:Troponin T n=1 Tax=Varroa destructor TaxID=109461 RepID=A0A7M7JAD7_VARDE|nr:troponin T-like isoform X2 [Varroa destructor]